MPQELAERQEQPERQELLEQQELAVPELQVAQPGSEVLLELLVLAELAVTPEPVALVAQLVESAQQAPVALVAPEVLLALVVPLELVALVALVVQLEQLELPQELAEPLGRLAQPEPAVLVVLVHSEARPELLVTAATVEHVVTAEHVAHADSVEPVELVAQAEQPVLTEPPQATTARAEPTAHQVSHYLALVVLAAQQVLSELAAQPAQAVQQEQTEQLAPMVPMVILERPAQ